MRIYKTSVHPHTPPTQPHQSEHSPATQDKEVGLLVALEGPVGSALAFSLFPAFGQDPAEQARVSVCLRLGGHGLWHRDLVPPHREGALVLTVATIQHHSSSSSSAPPPECLPNVSTGGQRGNNKHKGPVYSS